MIRFLKGAVFVLVFAAGTSCSQNILSTFADKNTDAAKYIEAQKLIDGEKYDDAIAVLLSASADFQTDRKFKSLLASAYAGRAGLNFLDLIQSFQDASGVTLFSLLMPSFHSADMTALTSKVMDLDQAADTLKSIASDPAQRSQDENILMVLVSFAKIGYILNTYTDTDHNGSVDGTFTDACSTADTPGTSIGDTAVAHIGLALVNALNALPEITNNFTSNVLGSIDDCQSDIEPYMPGVCSADDTSDFSAAALLGFRSLIKESDAMGLGVSCSGDVSACHCP
jgi:hypothetical protein